MMDSLALLEQRLAKAYADQAAHYDIALGILERTDIDHDGSVLDLQAALKEVARIDASITDDKAVWLQSGNSPGPALRGILERLAQQIRILAQHVDRRVVALTAKRQRIVPELDGFLRQRRMLQAYDKYAKQPQSGEN